MKTKGVDIEWTLIFLCLRTILAHGAAVAL